MQRLRESKLVGVLSYRDFRILWIGAFLSFTGSWMQTVAQGYYVYHLTEDESKLALVSFASSFPVFLFGFMAGSLADAFDRRVVLIATQALLGAAALYLAIATYFHFVRYEQIVIVAFITGLVSCVEMPVRQSVVSRVVPPEDLAAAVPVNAMTFNVARIFGPALGGIMLAQFGVPICYLLNGLSFVALIWSATRIRSDLSAVKTERQPMRDLVFEGMLYTFRDVRLRTLFILESLTACFGIIYLPLLPAFVKQVMGFGDVAVRVNGKIEIVDLSKAPIAHSYTAVGIGAFVGLLFVTHFSDRPYKAHIVRASMWTIAICLGLLSFARTEWIAYPLFGFLGMAVVAQFNTTNALFQVLSPDRLRGRVLAMHIWGLNGLAPFGTLFYGWLANTSRNLGYVPMFGLRLTPPTTGVMLAVQTASFFVLAGAVGATLSRVGLRDLEVRPDPDA